MTKLKQLLTLTCVTALLFSACKKADNTTPTTKTDTLLVTISPAKNATGIIRNASVTATFNLAMDPTSINATTFLLKNGMVNITGTVSYSGLVATFVPAVLLEANTVYTITVTTGAKTTTGIVLSANAITSFTTSGGAVGQPSVFLGSAINYVILAKTAINNNPISAITGDLGLSPAATSYITGLSLTNATGYATSSQVTGKVYAADMAPPTAISLTTSVDNMITAYNDAAGRPTPDFVELATGNIGGRTLSPGLYNWSNTVTIPATVTISGGPNDIWVFQIAGNLNQAAATNIILTGGAQAKNIFWQVAGEVTLGATAHFEGIILCQTGITLGTGASLNGRALSQTAVILDGNTVVQPQ
ncbi:MAG: ice-binding family protein [Bacteroidota bacterium]